MRIVLHNVGRVYRPGIQCRRLKTGRHHADYHPRLFVESQGPSDDTSIPAESPLPVAVVQNRNTISSMSVFVWQECPADNCGGALNFEPVRGRTWTIQLLRLALACEIHP